MNTEAGDDAKDKVFISESRRIHDADFRVLTLSSDNKLLAAAMSNSVIKVRSVFREISVQETINF